MNKWFAPFILLLALASLAGISHACTDFLVKAADGSVVVGRSMEFAIGLYSDIVVYPRAAKMVSRGPDNAAGLEWAPKYGYVGIDAFKETASVMDGINEAGLSAEFLWYTEARYNEPVKGDRKWLAITDLSHWILGNFATVSEVKREIAKIRVIGAYVPALKQVPGIHAAVHDATGNSIVIEFIDGRTLVYDNPLGVMTNKPAFDWHLTNLRNYVNLSPFDRGTVQAAGMAVEQIGSSSGWLGLPGDWTPPSRFVRTAAMVFSADTARDATGAVNLAAHILNAVDIPRGVVRTRGADNSVSADYTQWIVIKDLTNRVVYFRSYRDLALKKIDLKQLDFGTGAAARSAPIADDKDTVIDLTPRLK